MANIELDGTNKKIKVDSGDLTLDVPGDIILDADGADLTFADGGTNILKVTNSSSDVVFQNQVDAKDIIFKQYDGTEVAKIDDDGSFKVANSTLGISQSSSDVIIKPLTDAKDIIFQQYDGTAVATVEDNGTFNIPASKLAIGGTAVTSTAAEINLIDGGTARGTTAIADGDGVLINDAGTMRMTNVTTLKTYIGGGIDCDADAWARVAPVTDQDSAAVIDWATSIHMGSNISESAGVITVGTAGWYLVTFHISNQSAYSDNMNMYLRKNDTRVLGSIYWEGNTEINYLGMEATVLVECSANDTLDVYGTGYYTGNTNNQSATWFTGVRLGA